LSRWIIPTFGRGLSFTFALPLATKTALRLNISVPPEHRRSAPRMSPRASLLNVPFRSRAACPVFHHACIMPVTSPRVGGSRPMTGTHTAEPLERICATIVELLVTIGEAYGA